MASNGAPSCMVAIVREILIARAEDRSQSRRVDKQSASTFGGCDGGCALLIHPTGWEEVPFASCVAWVSRRFFMSA